MKRSLSTCGGALLTLGLAVWGCSPASSGVSLSDGGASAADGGGSSSGASSGSSQGSSSSSTSGSSSSSSGASSSSSGASSSSSGASSSSSGASSSGGNPCSGLAEYACSERSDCQIYPGCCPGDPNVCGLPNQGPGCPDFCPPPTCTDLSEDACQHTQGCVADYCHLCSCEGTYQGCRAQAAPPLDCPALGCLQPLCECNTLDERGCLAERGTCDPLYCQLCTPASRFMGCFAPNQDPGCPEVDCPPTCTGDGDCPSQATCAPPGSTNGCGACLPPSTPCFSDLNCTPGEVCQPARCACNGESECVPGCGPERPCREGETCMPSGRCEPQACGAQTCAWNFVCADDETCVRRPCSDSSVCRGGTCVLGACYDEPGFCAFPAP